MYRYLITLIVILFVSTSLLAVIHVPGDFSTIQRIKDYVERSAAKPRHNPVFEQARLRVPNTIKWTQLAANNSICGINGLVFRYIKFRRQNEVQSS